MQAVKIISECQLLREQQLCPKKKISIIYHCEGSTIRIIKR